MDWSCLVLNLNEGELAEKAKAECDGYGKKLPLHSTYTTSKDEALTLLDSGKIASLIVLVQESSNALENVLTVYQAKIGALTEFQMIVVDDPSPRFLVSVFEYGVEKFCHYEHWLKEVVSFQKFVSEKIKDKTSSESKTLKLSQAIKNADRQIIAETENELKEQAEYDFTASYAMGKVFEANGNYAAAAISFENSNKLNKMFRPSQNSLAESMLINGKPDEAAELLEKLEKSNPRNVHRKTMLASVYIEKGDLEKADQYIKEAQALNPESKKILEVSAQLLLCKGDIQGAFKLIDNMENVGPFFASKLNELGVKLSQSGKGQSALALYQKAHKVVRQDLKYKISLNAALACRRMENFELALKYTVRCKKEYGGSFEKLDKIEKNIQTLIAAKTP